jgi:hypothetical protein
MARGRPRLAGTVEERAEARRARVRMHVQAFRQRQKDRNSPHHLAVSGGQFAIVVEDPGLKLEHEADAAASSVTKVYTTSSVCSVKPGDPSTQTATHQISLPKVFDQGHAYKVAFYSALLESYKPAGNMSLNNKGLVVEGRYEQEPIPSTCETWIFSACYSPSMYGADALGDAMLSMALGVVGAHQSEMQLIVTGRRMYQKALSKVSRSLTALQSSRQSAELTIGILAATCLACAWVELMANRSSKNFEKHLDGIASLFESCGFASLRHPFTRAVFLDHRGTYVAFCFLNRKSCFYSRPEWIEYQMRMAVRRGVNCYDTLLNIAYPVTVLIENYDLGLYASIQGLRELTQSVLEADRSMTEWKTETEESFLVPVMLTSPSEGAPPFLEQVSYPSLSAALALLYYSAFKIHLYLMLLDITDDLQYYDEHVTDSFTKSAQRALECATTICASLNFCLSPDSGVFGKSIALFPFDAAWQVFLRLNKRPEYDMSNEVVFCEKTANRFTQMGFTLLSNRSAAQRCDLCWSEAV